MTTSAFSDDVIPHLSERDARVLAGQVTEAIRRLGVLPSQIGVQLETDGFWFSCLLNGRLVTARTGQGNFTYAQVAQELVLASVDPGWDALTIQKGASTCQ